MSTKNENNQYKGDMMDRRKFIISTGGAITSLTLFGVDAFAALPKLRKKSKYKIGFAQKLKESKIRKLKKLKEYRGTFTNMDMAAAGLQIRQIMLMFRKLKWSYVFRGNQNFWGHLAGCFRSLYK